MAIDPEQILTGEPKITNRAELVTALQAAAEVEHLLCCEYLFAGFSVRRTLADFPEGTAEASNRVTLDRSRPWLAILYQIARQEMDHLGIVCNLLAAVGAEPHFDRPAFPQPASHSLLGIPLALDRLSRESIRRFIWYERPTYLTPGFPWGVYGLPGWNPPAAARLPVHSLRILNLEDLYLQLSRAFLTLPAREIFVGDPDRQLGNAFSFQVKVRPVTNREEAKEAMRQILAEGEGIGLNPLTASCHFQRFSHMLRLYEEAFEADPAFDPALPVVTNPRLQPHPHGFPTSVIRRPETAAVMRHFEGCYHAMLVMLKTFFATYSANFTPEPRPQAALFYAAFFPLMTMAIRPLGQILARMPAGDEHPGQNAGASFDLGGPVVVQTDVEWYRERLAALADEARGLRDAVPDRLRGNMGTLYENLTSTRLHLEHIWEHGR